MTRARLAPMLVTALLAAAANADFAQTELEPETWKLHVASTTNGNPDPVQDTEECLQGDQLKDLGSYFAPSLEGVEADCKKTRQPSNDPRKVDYRTQCTGRSFTMKATTSVTIESARHFTAAMRLETRTERETAVVVADIDGARSGPCKEHSANLIRRL